MTDLDLAELRRNIEGSEVVHKTTVLALLDRIKELEAERDKAQRACRTLGKVVDDQARAALDATGLHHLIDETGDGDWGAVWENLAELGERARTAEARLDRVTDLHRPETRAHDGSGEWSVPMREWTSDEFDGDPETFEVCGHCGPIEMREGQGDSEGASYLEALWPCATIRSIEGAALDLIESLEARLDRVTFADVIERARAEAAKRWHPRKSDRLPGDWLDEGMASGFVLGAQWAIRAVAADEQPSHVHDGDAFKAGECCGAPHCKADPHIEGCYATDPDEAGRDAPFVAADEQETDR